MLHRRLLSKKSFAVFVLCAATTVASPAQTFTTLFSFDGTNGETPEYGLLIQGTDGNLYGTTTYGGDNIGNNEGTVFKITTSGQLTTLYSFCVQTYCTDGANPTAGVVQGTNGNFYGTTSQGGVNLGSSVFEVTPEGQFSSLYSFCPNSNCSGGTQVFAGLVQAPNRNFYGTASLGGTGCGGRGCGTVFEITPEGFSATLYSLCSQPGCTDGEDAPWSLMQAANGNFYGTTPIGGAFSSSALCPDGCGTIFEITPAGKLTTLYNFCAQTNCTDGFDPTGTLIQATNGNFYGTTFQGGANNRGTVFEITQAGKLTTLYSFCSRPNCTDGEIPYNAGLVQATDGNFYGVAGSGGDAGRGTIFKITPAGRFTRLYTFCAQPGCSDGANPFGGLVQATNGTFYGTTSEGGISTTCVPQGGCGTIFSLSVGLGPFIETRHTSGQIGASVVVLGNDLTGATAASFNGTAATFTVVSDTEIKTAVPAGATTGTVQVTTASGGTLNSNVAFRVTPLLKSFTPLSGPIGTLVTITGSGLTQSKGVRFGPVNASFVVNSDTQVTATVPTGATTGMIVTKTTGGTATSTGSFTVTLP
jgi:uncharacterized repeat protein (TIGR03803 family)